MSTENQSNPSTALTISRGEKLQTLRDDMAPGAIPGAIVPRTFAEAQAMCMALAAADLVPRAYRNKPVDMLLVVMTGLEVGLPPMASLRLYTTWDGVARLMAEGIRAVVLRHPDIEYFEPLSSSETSATWVGKRRGRPEKSATWTVERAKRADLLGKENWRKYQEDMLNARASMQLGRMIAPDIIAGMVSREEAMDGDFIDAQFTENKPAQFVAPPPAQAAPQGPPPGVPAVDPPRRGPGRPPKADPTPPQQSSAGPAASAPSSTTSAPSSSASTAPDPSIARGEPVNKLDAAVAAVEQKMAERADPAPPSSNTGPTRSGESVAASTAQTTSGVAAGADDFGSDDPVDTAPPSKDKLADFFAWLAECKTQRDLQAGLHKWKAWSEEQGKVDDSFKKSGENTKRMSEAYGRRKGEVPA